MDRIIYEQMSRPLLVVFFNSLNESVNLASSFSIFFLKYAAVGILVNQRLKTRSSEMSFNRSASASPLAEPSVLSNIVCDFTQSNHVSVFFNSRARDEER